jgi:Protein of unknown function (DUF1569)
MTQAPPRRALVFHDLDEVVRDAKALLSAGYEKAGNWDLGQVANHLADWMRFPVEGFPKAPAPIRAAFWVLRKTIGRKKLLGYLKDKSFPAGKPTMPETVHLPDEDERAAIENLKQRAERLKAYTGPIVPSPLFGHMTKDEAVGMQLVHCAHHLSFLIPKQG